MFRSGWLVARMVLVGLIKKKNYLDGGGGATRWVTPQSVWFNTVGGAVGCAVALAKCLYFPSVGFMGFPPCPYVILFCVVLIL